MNKKNQNDVLKTKYWPVPDSYSKEIPERGRGCFWEDRLNWNHTGVDIYAPIGSYVLSIEKARVIASGVFTSPLPERPYWNETYFILVKNDSGLICRYAELSDVLVRDNEQINAGQLIGSVAQILIPEKIDMSSPKYIQNLKKEGKLSMLHFELWNSLPDSTQLNSERYKGGNWLDDVKPNWMLDPTDYLKSISHNENRR